MTARSEGYAWDSTNEGWDPPEPELRILELAAHGDPGALDALYRTHAPPAYRLAYGVTRSITDAQDVVQDLFVGLPEALASFQTSGTFSAWFRMCAARQSLVHMRTRRRRHEVELRPDRRAPAGVPPLDRIELDLALGQLPEALRVIVVLRDIEGFRHEEIAMMLGISASASRMRLMRGRRHLRGLMGPNTGSAG